MFTRICITSLIVLANSLTAVPAKADTLPYLFARHFCNARHGGMTTVEAVRLAVHESTIPINNAILIKVDERVTYSDIHSATDAAYDLCPEMLPY